MDVWKKSVDLAVVVYKATENFPKEEKFGLTSQIRRASVSISANIAEGAALASTKEFLYFLSNAQGSASEVATEILIAFRLGFLDKKIYSELYTNLDEIGRMISGLRQHLRSKEK